MAEPILTNPLAQINAAWQQGRQMAFDQAAGKALTSTGTDQQDALAQASQINPGQSLDLQRQSQAVIGQKLLTAAKLLSNAPDSQKDAFYQNLKPTLAQLGMDPSTLPANYDDTVAQTAKSIISAYTPYNAMPAAVRTAEYFSQNLSPEDKAKAMRIKVGLDPRAANPNYTTVEVPDGQGGKILAFRNSHTGQLELPDYSGIEGAPQGGTMPGQGGIGQTMGGTGGWNVTTSTPSIADMANQAMDAGATPDQAIQTALKRSGNPNQAFTAAINPQTGRFEDRPVPAGAQPTAVDAAGNPSSSAPAGAAPAAGSPLGYTPPKADKNEVDKRAAELQALKGHGIQFTPQQEQEFLLTGKAPDVLNGGSLTADQEKLAHALASYQVPASARFFSDPRNQAIAARALELNPGFNAPQYEQNKKVLTDLASTAPTSGGGGIIAANTALQHLQAMSDASEKLPDNFPLLNKAQEFIASHGTGKGDLAQTVKEWDTAKQLAAAEIQKMVKSGVATEGETKSMLDNLSAADTKEQRSAALATLAEFMNDKVMAQESRRDAVLGDASPGTSFLNAKAQRNFSSVLQRAGHAVPDLRAPYTSLGMAVKPAAEAAPTQPAAAATPSVTEDDRALLSKYGVHL